MICGRPQCVCGNYLRRANKCNHMESGHMSTYDYTPVRVWKSYKHNN
jgi:hypothetical protein